MDLSRLKVIYEDNHYIAVNKPAGWLVQADSTGDLTLAELVKQYIKIRYKKPGDVFLGIVHRLDRPVSGVLFFARTSKGLSRMNKLFKEREMEKTYLAIVKERPYPIEGELIHYLIKDREKNKVKAYDFKSSRAKNAKKAVLTYKLIGEKEGYHLLEVNLKTGRPHQIRVQLSKLGSPIWGDLKYGSPQPLDDGSIGLHCIHMKFMHPVKKEPVFVKAMPPSILNWDQFKPLVEEKYFS